MKNYPPVLLETNFQLPGQKHFYRGKVRDVYTLADERLIVVATDRLSAFDVVLPQGIPYKGQVLNQLANYFLDAAAEIVPTWKIASPDPLVTVGQRAQPFKVEMVVRGYLAGHALRQYLAGHRELCGQTLPEGLMPYEALPEAIITPTTKADQGEHDADIAPETIVERGLLSAEAYRQLADYSLRLFAQGQTMAAEKGLILADTKYEFGQNREGQIVLIDEIHTPDSSRYFLAADYAEKIASGQPPKQLSKEFVRQWLIERGFQGLAGQELPEISPEFALSVGERYVELYEKLSGKNFAYPEQEDLAKRVKKHILEQL